MTDYEQLVKALRWCDASFLHECGNCLYVKYKHCKDDCMDRMLRDAADAIEALQAQLPKRGEIVRCVDCKWNMSCGYISTRSFKEWKDWFCADGERKVQE